VRTRPETSLSISEPAFRLIGRITPKSSKGGGLTNETLRVKAAATNSSVLSLSKEVVKEMVGTIEELNDLSEKERHIVSFTTVCVSLVKAQCFFRECVADKEESVKRFGGYLYSQIERSIGVDPIPWVEEYLLGCRYGQTDYIGTMVCKEIGKKDVSLALKISACYGTFLAHVFVKYFQRIWETPAEEILQKVGADVPKEGWAGNADSV